MISSFMRTVLCTENNFHALLIIYIRNTVHDLVIIIDNNTHKYFLKLVELFITCFVI